MESQRTSAASLQTTWKTRISYSLRPTAYLLGATKLNALEMQSNFDQQRLLVNKQLDSFSQRLRGKPTMGAMNQETIDAVLQKGFIIEVDDHLDSATGKW